MRNFVMSYAFLRPTPPHWTYNIASPGCPTYMGFVCKITIIFIIATIFPQYMLLLILTPRKCYSSALLCRHRSHQNHRNHRNNRNHQNRQNHKNHQNHQNHQIHQNHQNHRITIGVVVVVVPIIPIKPIIPTLPIIPVIPII